MSKLFQDLLAAMKMLGLNPMEQEIIDLTNNIVRNGYIYFPEFCKEGVQIFFYFHYERKYQYQSCNKRNT